MTRKLLPTSKWSILVCILALPGIHSYAQQKEAADNLVNDGVEMQDRGQVDSALANYQQALLLDKNNLMALSEMAYSYLSINKFNEAANYAKRAIKTHPDDPLLKSAYVAYGNAVDGMGRTSKSIEIFDEGIRLFPEYFQLYYNRGISLNKLNKKEEAIRSFQRSVALNPDHASSHNALGVLLMNHNNIPSLMAFSRFLILEPDSRRSGPNLENVKKITGDHFSKEDGKSITISLSPDLLDTNAGDRKNNFSAAELTLSLSAVLDKDSNNMDKTPVENFIRKYSALCGQLKESEKDSYGFYWDYYVPYFTEMNEKGYLTTFAYILFTSSREKYVLDWLTGHPGEIEEFYQWSQAFKWRIE